MEYFLRGVDDDLALLFWLIERCTGVKFYRTHLKLKYGNDAYKLLLSMIAN